MRLFLAIELPPAVQSHLGRLQEALRSRARVSWTRPANLHLTLQFLGEMPETDVPGLTAALAGVRQKSIGGLCFTHLEMFPPAGRVRIVGAALAGDIAVVHQLHDAIQDATVALGFAPEHRAYRPHATLGRAGVPLPGSLRAVLAAAAELHWPGPRFDVHEFVLMQSRLRSEGAQYLPVARFALT